MRSQFALEIEWSSRRGESTAHLPTLVGPFGSRTEADKWATLNIPNGSWIVTSLAYPWTEAQR